MLIRLTVPATVGLVAWGVVLALGACFQRDERSPGASEAWALAAEPVVAIRSSESPGEVFFTRISSAELVDSLLLLSNLASPPAVFGFSVSGELVWKRDRRGEGPGEFAGVARIWSRPGGRVAVYDPWASRISEFSAKEGVLLETISLTWLAAQLKETVSIIGYVGPNLLVGRPNRSVSSSLAFEGEARGRSRSPLLLVDLVTKTVDTLVHMARLDYVRNRSGSVRRQPFGGAGVVAASSRGVVYFGIGDSFDLEAVEISSNRTLRLGRPYRRRPVSDAMIDAWRENGGEESPGPVPPTLPAYDRIFVDAADRVWVREYQSPLDEREAWSIFDRSGRLKATLPLPPGMQLIAAAEGRVVVARYSALDVPDVFLFDLRQGPPASVPP